jgi:hypothetical protein
MLRPVIEFNIHFPYAQQKLDIQPKGQQAATSSIRNGKSPGPTIKKGG